MAPGSTNAVKLSRFFDKVSENSCGIETLYPPALLSMRGAVAQLVKHYAGDGKVACSSITASRVTVLCPRARYFSTA